MQKLKFKWLISGHLDEDKAKEVCKLAADAIKHLTVSDDDIVKFNQIVKLPEKQIQELEYMNNTPDGDSSRINPNSCALAYF